MADYIHDLREIIGPRKIILNCAGAIIVRNEEILFQRRKDNGKWGLIGGLLEMNETYEQAALREIREETGLEVWLDSFLGIFHNHDMVWSNGDAAHVVSAMFTARIISGEPRIDDESYELKFFSWNDMPELFAEDHIAALDAYFKGIRYPVLRENEYHSKLQLYKYVGDTREERSYRLKLPYPENLIQEIHAMMLSRDDRTKVPDTIPEDVLEWALSKLKKQHREYMMLRFKDHLTYKEIGERMGVGPETARGNLRLYLNNTYNRISYRMIRL